MTKVSEVYKTKPETFENEVQKETYRVLEELNIPFSRVDTSDAITMEDCIEIDNKLNVKTVKTLLLCNRQKTNFYMFITTANKMFSTKKFSEQLGISRVSFATEEMLAELLGTKIGATTIFSMLLDKEQKVNLIIDKDILTEEDYGCADGTYNCYMKLKMDDVINKIIPYSKHIKKVIEM